MEPFSTATAALAVIGTCNNVITHCRHVLRTAKSIEAELNTFIDELANLRSLMTSVRESSAASEHRLSPEGRKKAERIHKQIRSAIHVYRTLVERLYKVVLKISGADPDGRLQVSRSQKVRRICSSVGDAKRLPVPGERRINRVKWPTFVYALYSTKILSKRN